VAALGGRHFRAELVEVFAAAGWSALDFLVARSPGRLWPAGESARRAS